MQNENGQNGNGQPSKSEDPWSATIRGLIKDENDLFANRLAWTGTFQGLLLTALTFSWGKVIGQYSFAALLCGLGMGQAFLSLWALFQARMAIKRLLDKWLEHNKTIDPLPVWGWVEVETPLRQVVITSPGLLIPVVLLILWGYIGLCLPHLEPQWQSFIQDNLKQVFLHKSDEEAKQAITALAYIRGNADDGKKVFHNYCARCHTDDSTSRDKDKSIPDLFTLRGYNREGIVRGILYPNPNQATRGENVQYMENGLTTRMLPEEFIDVVEYLQQPDKKYIIRVPIRAACLPDSDRPQPRPSTVPGPGIEEGQSRVAVVCPGA